MKKQAHSNHFIVDGVGFQAGPYIYTYSVLSRLAAVCCCCMLLNKRVGLQQLHRRVVVGISRYGQPELKHRRRVFQSDSEPGYI